MPREKVEKPIEASIETAIAGGLFSDDAAVDDVSGNSTPLKEDGTSNPLKADGTSNPKKVA